MKTNNWFEVDKDGLAKLLADKGKEFLFYELIQNAFDTDATYVSVTLDEAVRGLVRFVVEDDDPNGFSDMSHAFTLFAESSKKADPEKRGRFNLGEKLVLALCNSAEIVSTTGTVRFDRDGRKTSKKKTESGSRFEGIIRMNHAERERVIDAISYIIQPSGIKFIVQRTNMSRQTPITTFEAALPTVLADGEGSLRRTVRKTVVELFSPMRGQTGWLYEMGIPVVETGDSYDVNVHQKIPLNFQRDNASAAYLRDLRAHVLNNIKLTPQQSSAKWVSDGLESPEIKTDAVASVVKARFGDKAVIYDPSDLEANKLAVSRGYTVVHGGMLSADAWQNVKAADAIKPAGQVTPSPKPYGDGPVAPPPSKITDAMNNMTEFVRWLGKALMDVEVAVEFISSRNVPASATYGGRRLTFNVAYLGYEWFERIGENQIALILHEFGHEYSSDHLSSKYHDALCGLGAKLALLKPSDKARFDEFRKDIWEHSGNLQTNT